MTKHPRRSPHMFVVILAGLLAVWGGYAHFANAIPIEDGTPKGRVTSFTASPSTISTAGQAVTLSWGCSALSSSSGSGFSTGGARSGSATVHPTKTTTYSVTCSTSGGSSSRSLTVVYSTTPPPTATLSASKSDVLRGTSSTLTWSSTHATACYVRTLDGDVTSNHATSGSVTVTPTATVQYYVDCVGPDLTASAYKTVTVHQPVAISTFSSNPPTITRKDSANLYFLSSYSTSCTINNGGGTFTQQSGNGISGNVSVTPDVTTTYTLTCTGYGGSTATKTTKVTVNGPPLLVASCSPSKSSTNIGGSVTWTAHASGGTAPYSYEWLGDQLSGFTGTSKAVTYPSSGTKTGSVTVTDSGVSSTGGSVNYESGTACTGPIYSSYSISDTEDGGTGGLLRAFTTRPFHDANAPAAFKANPQNYCVSGSQTHQGGNCAPFGSGTCPWYYSAEIHSGSGRKSQSATVHGQTTTTYGSATYSPSSDYNDPQIVSNSCTSSVTVKPNQPTATISAKPISTLAGDTSTLTYSSTNAGACSISSGVGSVTPNKTGTKTVNPTTTTTYTITCTGDTGTTPAKASVTVSVTPKPPPPTNLHYSCNSNGTAVTLAWNAAPGAANYYVRLQNSSGTYAGYTNGYTGTSITYTITPSTSYSWWVHSNIGAADFNTKHYSAAAYGPGISCAGKANLTAGATSVPSAEAKKAVTFSATVSNTGNGTSGSFPTRFQVADSGLTKTIGNAVTGYTALGVSASKGVSAAYTFASPGTYKVRACANQNSAGTNIVTETNYGDNCGPWKTVSVAPAYVPPPVCTLSASPSSKVPSTLTWSCTNATTCTGAGFSTGNAMSGTKNVSTAGNYVVSCTSPGGSDSDSVSLAAPCTNPKASISAKPTRVQKGGKVTLTYSGTGTDAACSVKGPGVSVTSAAPASCTVSPATIPNVVINAQSTYTVTCGSAKDSVIVNIVPDYTEF